MMIDLKEIVEVAGGPTSVAQAITRRHRKVSRQSVHLWIRRNRLPRTEWTGETSYARVIADLATAHGYPLSPAELCPGAGQYMETDVERRKRA